MHGRIQASGFKWSSGAWHQIALWVQFYCRHVKAATVTSVEFLEWEILEAKSWPCFCGQLEAGLVQCAGVKNGSWGAMKMQVWHSCRAKPHVHNCLSWVGADAEAVSFRSQLQKMESAFVGEDVWNFKGLGSSLKQWTLGENYYYKQHVRTDLCKLELHLLGNHICSQSWL